MHVLIVDDNAADLLLATEAFEQADASVQITTCESGERAAHLLRTLPDGQMPDLVLIDVNMPGISGFDLLTRIKRDPHLCALPVIVLSTSSHPEDVRRAYALQASAYVVKPTDFTVFRTRIGALVTYWSHATRPVIPAQGLPPHLPG